jgi:hypothetical protein
MSEAQKRRAFVDHRRQRHLFPRLSAGNGGDDADLVARFDRSLGFAEKSNVFVVQVNIHESSDLILIVADALFQPGIGVLKTIDQLADGSAFSVNDFLIFG